ncbi:F-box only protein 9-like [Hydractinia symbiolongicarpus]|uniref:F-box only protein 9-like n=1 Tax=Hydractinia symbiolongicarpus TaxID=13093 RepID=UPI002551B132|nr:F-box only protein 9-like [Hydractinia symbiolongicarpus]
MSEKDVNLQDELASFRQQWQEEIVSESSQLKEKSGVETTTTTSGNANDVSTEKRAAHLFMEGVRHERNGDVYAAVYFYRQAVHLVPDIEFKLAEYQITVESFSDDESDDDENIAKLNPNFDTSSELDSITKTFGCLHVSNLCSPRLPQQTTHISKLPTELLILIIKWVVSKDLDISSLERLSLVCKWFYACARDEELWKLVCVRAWGIHCSDVHLYHNSWRMMFIEKPRVRYNGLYISKNSYIRYGAPSLDSCYKPCYLVEYYRYLRFFTDGTILVYTSADDPQQVVHLLNRPPYRDPTVHKGYYRLTGENTVNVFFSRTSKHHSEGRRRRTHRDKVDVKEENFFMQLLINNTKKKRNNKLVVYHYSYEVIHRKTGQSCKNDIDFKTITPFFFSPVRSYQAVSTSSL